MGLGAQRGTFYSTSQHTITWRTDRRLVRKGAGLRAQCRTFYSTSQNSITWQSDGKLVRKEAGLRAQYKTLYDTQIYQSTLKGSKWNTKVS